MIGILIGTLALVALALTLAAYGFTQAAAFLGVAAALAAFAIATVALRQWATRDCGAVAREGTGRPKVAAVPDDNARRAA
jgi:uncharacterized membrane protein